MTEKTDSGQGLFEYGPGRTLKLENGEEIAIPKLTWGVEAAALSIVGKTLREVPEAAVLFQPGQSAKNLIYSAIPKVLEVAPKQISELIACVLGKKKDIEGGTVYDIPWVEDTLTLEDVVRVLVPFMQEYSNKLVKLTKQMGDAFPQLSKEAAEVEKAPSQPAKS